MARLTSVLGATTRSVDDVTYRATLLIVATDSLDGSGSSRIRGGQLLQERLANQTERIRRYLGHELKAGLPVTEAGERFCALASPDLYHLLTIELHWTADHHQTWLTKLLHTELLG